MIRLRRPKLSSNTPSLGIRFLGEAAFRCGALCGAFGEINALVPAAFLGGELMSGPVGTPVAGKLPKMSGSGRVLGVCTWLGAGPPTRIFFLQPGHWTWASPLGRAKAIICPQEHRTWMRSDSAGLATVGFPGTRTRDLQHGAETTLPANSGLTLNVFPHLQRSFFILCLKASVNFDQFLSQSYPTLNGHP